MYGAQFCKVYNEFGWNYFPDAFAEQLLKWLKIRGIVIHDALDLGCGTGVLCNKLSESGIQTIGTDLSPDMIHIAQTNYPSLQFDVADMIEYHPSRTFDLVTCTGDALNHLPDLQSIAHVFNNVYSYLAVGGYFVFDILSGREIGDGTPIDLDYDEHTKACFQIICDKSRNVKLNISVSRDGQPAFNETVDERIYSADDIRTLLEKCGFVNIELKDRLLDSDNCGTSWYFIAQKC